MGITTRSLDHSLGMVTEQSTYGSSLYVFVARTHDSEDENVVETANVDNYNTSMLSPMREMIFGKKILPSDISLVIDRYNWESDKVYKQYDHDSNTLFTVSDGDSQKNFFVYSSSGNVYKCIDNNNQSKSTVEPSHQDLTPRTESDGYSWKYMFTVPAGSKFLTSSYVPVVPNTSVTTAATLGIDRYQVHASGNNYAESSNGTVQSVVTNSKFVIENKQLSYSNGLSFTPEDDFYNNTSILFFESGAKANGQLFTIDDYTATSRTVTISGSASSVVGGTTQYEISPRVRVLGDGANATAIATVSSAKTITAVEVKNTGDSYSFANVIIDANTGSGADVSAIIAPPKGHGHNVAEELGADKIMFAITVEGNESNTITANIQNGFRTVGILTNPSPANVAFTGTVSTISGRNILTGSGTEFQNVFDDPNTATSAGLVVNAVNTDVLSDTSVANTVKADTIVEIINEFNKNVTNQQVAFDKIIVEGTDFDEIVDVADVSSNTVLYTRIPFAATSSGVNYRKVFTGNTFNNIITLTVDQQDLFSNGESVSSLDKDYFGTVVEQSANTLNIVGTKFPSNITIKGADSEATANIVTAEVSNTYVDGLYGHVLYINNVLKVSKTDSSNTDFKIVVKV